MPLVVSVQLKKTSSDVLGVTASSILFRPADSASRRAVLLAISDRNIASGKIFSGWIAMSGSQPITKRDDALGSSTNKEASEASRILRMLIGSPTAACVNIECTVENASTCDRNVAAKSRLLSAVLSPKSISRRTRAKGVFSLFVDRICANLLVRDVPYHTNHIQWCAVL